MVEVSDEKSEWVCKYWKPDSGVRKTLSLLRIGRQVKKKVRVY